ncbi:hypothetical protein WICMUC_002800 [Wickerhamomyces mucosus]|uniref:Uncharacterized protein n=1 Tax=Wickerhamomyces mucosus TaxID=1378264 RepID=A0A9P8PPH0_9ASCO|nr:hypothetical protein WICMUC_002800 [Wickerhamomyces mucosus]
MGNAESKLLYKNKVFKLAGHNNKYYYTYNERDEIQYNQVKADKTTATDVINGEEDVDEEVSSYDSDSSSFTYGPSSTNNLSSIPLGDDEYWKMFWEKPNKSEDIFNIISYQDCKIIQESNKLNFSNLILKIALKLVSETNNSATVEEFNKKHIINCVRILTKILPIAFEAYSESELDKIFWNLNYYNFSDKLSETVNSEENETSVFNSFKKPLSSSNIFKDNIAQKVKNSLSSSKVEDVDSILRNSQSLGQQLLYTLVDLLFITNFTVDSDYNDVNNSMDYKIDYKLWENGIGRQGKFNIPNPSLDSNRLEVLRLLIILTSANQFSLTPSTLVDHGSRFLTVLTCSLPRIKGLNLLYSLLNLVCRSCKTDNEINGLAYPKNSESEFVNYKNLRKLTVTYSLQLLSVLIIYPIPSYSGLQSLKFIFDLKILQANEKPYNLIRIYFGKIQKENELNFIYDHFIELLQSPISKAIEHEQSSFNILKSNFLDSSSSQFPILNNWSLEIVTLLWELLQCNKLFQKFVYGSKSHELIVTLFYYLRYYKNNEIWGKNLIFIMNQFLLFILSNEYVLNKSLRLINQNFYNNKLPNFYKLSQISSNLNNTTITLRDFLIIHISNIISTDQFDSNITPALFQNLYNLIPIKIDPQITVKYSNHYKPILSSSSSLAVIHIISTYFKELRESPLNNKKIELKWDMLAILLKSITQLLSRYQRESRTMIYFIVKREEIFQELLGLVNTDQIIDFDENGNNNSDSVENFDDFDNVESSDFEPIPSFPTGMSSKSKSKLPLNLSLKTNWKGYKPLLIILKIISFIKDQFPKLKEGSKAETLELLISIERLPDYERLIHKFSSFEYYYYDFETLKFHWSSKTLGWYESLVWRQIFHANYQNFINHSSNNFPDSQNSNYNGNSWFHQRKNSLASWWNSNPMQPSISSPSPSPSSSLPNSYFAPQSHSQIYRQSSAFLPDDYVLDDGVLKLSIWNNSQSLKLFKFIPKTFDSGKNSSISDVNNLFRRFRLNSASSLNTIDSSKSIGFNNGGSNDNSKTLTPINSRGQTPRNSISLTISRQNSNNSISFG